MYLDPYWLQTIADQIWNEVVWILCYVKLDGLVEERCIGCTGHVDLQVWKHTKLECQEFLTGVPIEWYT